MVKDIIQKNNVFWLNLPYFLFGFGIFITLIFAALYYKIADYNNKQYFEALVGQTEKSIEKRYFMYEQALQGGLGLFNASEFVNRNEWLVYVETLNIEDNLPGINGVGYIDYIEESNLPQYLDETRSDGWPEFKNKPKTEFTDKFIIKYIVPENKNLAAIGLDIGFESNRRSAAERARDIGLPILTKKIELVQDNKKSAGFLLLLPAYKTNAKLSTLDQRRQNILGWVYAPFIADNFLNDLDYTSSKSLNYKVYDGNITDENLIHKNFEIEFKGKYSTQTSLNIAGQTWYVQWQENSKFVAPSNVNITYVILLAGFSFVLIVFLFLKSVLNVNRRVVHRVKTQTSELSQSQQFLSLMMNSIPDLVFVKDKDFKIVRANQAFLNIYPPEKRDKVIGYTTIENFSEEERDTFLKEDRVAFENGISQINEEITLYNGRVLNIFTTKVRFCDDHNNEYILCIARDVSGLIETQKGLERKVEERTKEYKKQKTIAEKAGKAKEEFLASMSHELRTPLNSIIGLVKILIDEGDFNKEQSEALGIVDRASNSLLKTVNDVLDISKIEAGKVILDEKGFNISSLMHSLINQMKPLANQKRLQITDNLKVLNDCYIIADEHRITRIITNLIGNAIQYTDEGSIDIHVDLIDKDDNKIDVIISVTDTGIGISQDAIDIIFDKFAQADKPLGHNYGGTGLGLAITKQLVDLMGGDIKVESKVGKGSVFTTEFPLSKTSEEATHIYNERVSKIFDAEAPNNIRKEIFESHILVAEDHEFNQVFIAKTLQRIGCQNFKIVSNGQEALNLTKKEKFDVVLMDYHMPVLNGYEATQKIRENETDNHIPIIAMTADVMPGTEEKCLKAGMNAYVSKPIDESQLKQVLSKWFVFPQSDVKEENVKPENDACLDLSLLEEYTDGDLEAQKNLVQIFYDKSLKDIQDLEDLCLDGKSKKWCDAAHSLKGSAGYIGAGTLKNLCAVGQSMEVSTKAERSDIYIQIRNEYDKICVQLKKKKLLDV